MTPEQADKLLSAVQVLKDVLPEVELAMVAAFPGIAPFAPTAQAVLGKFFEVGAVYIAKQGDEAKEQLRANVLDAWGAEVGGKVTL